MFSIAGRNRAIKKALVKQYGKMVQVLGHRGTATGWVSIKISLPAPDHEHELNEYGRCSVCYKLSREECKKVEQIAREASQSIGAKIYNYSDDMGIEHDEMLTEVVYI